MEVSDRYSNFLNLDASTGRLNVLGLPWTISLDTTIEVNCRGGSRAFVGAAALAVLPRVFLQRVPL